MHLLIPFASALSDGGRAALRDLGLPNLQALLGLLDAEAPDVGDELSLSPPHERTLARAAGLAPGPDGTLPIAGLCAQRDGTPLAPGAWGRITPANWRVGTEQVSLGNPDELALDEVGSRALLDAVRDLFESEGFVLRYAAPTVWYAQHASLDGLPCASLDRVIGRNVDRWLAPDPRARLVRRMQSEVQMLLYTHPINDAREVRGELPVNSFWLSGCGVVDTLAWPAGLQLDDRLRNPALGEDWLAWTRAWHALDTGPLAELLARARRGDAAELTLCGERAAAGFRLRPRSLMQRLGQRIGAALRSPDVSSTLEAL
jgi:hypothetical protein